MRTIAALVVLAASAMASCPNLCSGNGRCGADDKCTCYRGYTGTDCSGRKCPYGKAWVEGSAEDPHSFAECSNKGVCERASGMCSCYEGYEGTACHRSTCPGACSGHGVCRYIEELSTNYAEFNWDTTKIQGCDCDAGFTGLDCASRLCPIGDDPMTVAPSLNGQRWTVSVDFHGGFPTTAEIHLDIGNLEDGSTVSTRPINILANSTAPFEKTLLDTGVIKSIASSTVDYSESGVVYTFTLQDPLRLSFVRNRWESDCTVAGCQPRKLAPVPKDALEAGAAFVSEEPHVKAESARCSNRGTCDPASGTCGCYEGFYGRACQYQTVLI
ncbi:hypothetical protein FNF29_04004 [Cafeteria roenbergensis]|jgi:hypothetical protein|uniref:EGF-like domain-containing protein n=1 Tax=Cafeteria roenbergensis TaxID=33653 RepID=A0A5A8DR33_CAFRO|nr:hypothetical protein FNF29_04004 [Cafeteria roenbergensis]KAA0158308.1 hypothetical protein FNF28_06284 [Cafeteria roenbergensis]KAA0167882.1 hypothetical protein FNF31_00817 [Cafeteria roenbergensis]|eukprot:KAA0152438.1 hypothetical protein FNF29_04004 [Cafeteria roenbergensis]